MTGCHKSAQPPAQRDEIYTITQSGKYSISAACPMPTFTVLTRVSRAPIGGLSNVAHPGKYVTVWHSPKPISTACGFQADPLPARHDSERSPRIPIQ
jgi:hypothetical protein